ncbi:MAG: methyltransferase domain-containing protein [Kineosporiaceae bacterium]|nr:methyltransferase domain-containing protein [Kineosporiaceae bacterium]MBK8074120.1 methyltransferase domain-containing protein [Kineosporiaceae bacterium]
MGCGDGTFAAWATTEGHDVTGLERDITRVLGGFRAIGGVTESLPFSDNVFDLVTSSPRW